MRWVDRMRRRHRAAVAPDRSAEVVEAARRLAVLERRLTVVTGGNGGNGARKRS